MIWGDELDDLTLANACSNKYVVGRALFAADNTCLFDYTYATFLQKRDISLATDQFYLWVIEQAEAEICMTYSIFHTTGIIVLELLRKDGIYPCNSIPVGILLFLCANDERDRILCRGWFHKQQLIEEKCRIIWFDEATIFKLLTDCELLMKSSHLLIPWGNLGKCIHNAVNRKTRTHQTITTKVKSTNLNEKKSFEVSYEIGGEQCIPVGDFFVMNTSVLSVLAEWAQSTGILSTTTNMNQIEQLWLFFHVNSRGFDRYALPPNLFHSMCESIHSHQKINTELITRIKNNTLAQLGRVGMNKTVTVHLMQQYTQCVEAFERNTLAYQVVSDQMKKYRDEYHFFRLYVSHTLDTFTTNAIQIAPLSVFDEEATNKWVSMILPMVNKSLCLETVCESIIKEAYVKVRYGDFILYNTLDNVTKELAKTYNISCPSSFKFETKHGTLNASIYNEPKLFWNKDSEYILPWNSGASPSHRRCLLSSNTRTPIWLNWPPTQSTPTHSWLIPSIVPYAKQLESILEDLNQFGGYVHEMINPYMHVSTLILDVDIKPLHPNDTMPQHFKKIQESFMQDMCYLIEYVLTRLLGSVLKMEQLHCYVFESKRASDEEKIGFHIHVALPSGIVFADKLVCQDVVKILNNMRIKYPNTLGLLGSNLFDVAIYGSSIHAIRGPYQRKPSGKDPLCCVYRTDQKPLTEKIPLQHQFVHGYQISTNTNEKVLQGQIVTKIQGFKLLDDDIFLGELSNMKINGGIRSLCSHEIVDIMNNINNMCVIFTCVGPRSSSDAVLLEQMANDLWVKHKHKIECRMHDEGYPVEQIKYIIHDTIFAIDKAGLSLVDRNTFRSKFPICLMKNHRSEPSDVMYRIKYGKKMIKMIITASCFKESCHGQNRLLGGNMEMMPVFLTPCVKKRVEYVWCVILKSHPIVKKIVAENTSSSDEIFETNSVEDLSKIIGTTSKMQRLFAITTDTNINHVLVFRSQYMVFVLFLWNEMDRTRPSLMYTCMDPILFINHITRGQLLSNSLLEAICNTLKSDGCIL